MRKGFKMNQNKKLLFIIIGLVFLAAIAGGIWYLNKLRIIQLPFVQPPFSVVKQQSPFCLWTQGPMINRQHAKEELIFIKDLGVNFIVVPAFPLDFEKKYADNNFSEAQKSFEVYKNSGLTMVPVSENPTKVSIKEFSETVKKAIQAFPQNKYWALFTEIDAVAPGAYFNMTDFQDNYYKGLAKKWALYTRIFHRLVKQANPDYIVVGPGTGGDFKSYLSKGTEYFDDFYNQNTAMKFNGFFVHYMDGLKEFEEIEKTPDLYDWNSNELKLTKEEFDIAFSPDKYAQYFDSHHYSNFDLDASKYYEPTTKLAQAIKDLFKKYGYENVKLWLTQTSTHTGKIESEVFGNTLSFQTEIEQAGYLVKKYITSIISGIDIICWTGPFEMQWGDSMEFGSPPNYQHFFSQVGLVYDGNGKYDEGAKLGKKDEIKKLSYYTYKKMVEVLDGSDWDNIQAVQKKDGVYVYKFTRQGKSIWAVWNDNSGTETITLNVGDTNQVKITKAIPKYNAGKEVKDYNAAFETETKSASNGWLTLTLDENPVYVEKK